MAEKMVEEFLLTDDECYKACEDAHLSPFATPYQERAVFLRAQVRKAYPMIDSLAYCRGYNEAKAEARQQALKTLRDWGNERCPHFKDTNLHSYPVIYSLKRGCDKCWNEYFEGDLPKE